jgi:hypothetical protein
MIRIKRVKRIAVAVKDLDKAVENWKRLFGVQTFQVGQEPEDRYHWAAFEIGSTRGDAEMTMEFLSPLNDPNGEVLIGKFIRTRGEGLYMITLETEGTAEEVARELKETGIASSWGGLTKQWVTGMESVGIESWTEHYISPKDANGVLVTLASVKYLPPKLVKTAPGKTFKKEKART